jgi:hypothetical protein
MEYTKKQARAPQLADPNQVREDERAEYEQVVAQVAKYSPGNSVAAARPWIDGEPYLLPAWTGWSHAPKLFTTLWQLGRVVQANQGEPGGYKLVDHELLNIVLGTDSGYWSFHAGHTANSITAGVRIEAMEAIADGREEDLTDDERQQVEFIRAVRDLTMTDDIWNRMIERLGSLRGTIELAFFVCYLMFHQRMFWVFGAPGMDPDEWRTLIQSYKDGTADPAPASQDYVWEVLDRIKAYEASEGAR